MAVFDHTKVVHTKLGIGQVVHALTVALGWVIHALTVAVLRINGRAPNKEPVVTCNQLSCS